MMKSQVDLFDRDEMKRLDKHKFKDQSILDIDYHQNSIITLLNGPDTRYEQILMNGNEQLSVPVVNDCCPDKNAFLQIHVRPLNAKQQKRLLEKQSKRHCQSIKKTDKCLHFTFPITYPCPKKLKTKSSSTISNSSTRSFPQNSTSQLSNNLNRLKSAVSILFNDDISPNKIPKENHSSLFLHIPSKKISTHEIHSSNACIQKHLCQLCGSILSNGICSCIIHKLLHWNKTKENASLVQLNDIVENLTNNNIII